jgi:phage-related protein
MKRIFFLGDTLDCIRDFPLLARSEVGAELRRVQMGLEPTDWKPMKTVGAGVREIRVRDESGAYRVIYEQGRCGLRAERLSKEDTKDAKA